MHLIGVPYKICWRNNDKTWLQNTWHCLRRLANYTRIHSALQDLSRQSKKLITRRESYTDRQDDFVAWRQVSKTAAEVDAEACNACQVYGNAEFKALVDELWPSLHRRFEAQPLTFLSSHKAVSKEVEVHKQRIVQWLENRREEFDLQRQSYQKLLTEAGIQAELRVPFDREKPA